MATTTLRCRAVLFDLDGVLVDSTECVERTWREWATRHDLDPERVISLAHGRRAIETVRLVAPELSADAELTALANSEATTSEGVYEIAGARELLARLPAGSWAIVTSGIRAVAEFRLRYTGLPVPPVMVCADEITRGKPDPEGYLLAAARLGRSTGGMHRHRGYARRHRCRTRRGNASAGDRNYLPTCKPDQLQTLLLFV